MPSTTRDGGNPPTISERHQKSADPAADLGVLQRVQLWTTGLRLLNNPDRLGDVFVLEELLKDSDASRALTLRALSHERGREAARERWRLPRVDMPSLRALPAGTLGAAFAAQLDARGLDPASLPRKPAGDDSAYVRAHLYETHDIWHVALGFDTDIAGELGVQAAYIAQVGGALGPLLVSGGLLHGILRDQNDWPRRLEAVMRGHAIAKQAEPLFGVRWDTLWATPLEAVRTSLRLPPNGAQLSPQK